MSGKLTPLITGALHTWEPRAAERPDPSPGSSSHDYEPTAAGRKRKERDTKRDFGLRPKEVWVHPNDWPQVRALVNQLSKKWHR